MKFLGALIVGALALVVSGAVALGEIKTVVDHNDNEQATDEFKFKNALPPSRGDAAAKAKFIIVDGRLDANGGGVEKLHDDKVPTEEDEPSENFFFGAGTPGGRLLVDLGGSIEI